jgi:glycosyltransferase involved in cell wall biosynthesis
MRLLYVTEEVPNRDPVHGNGSAMIPYEVLRHLPEDVEVTLLTYSSEVAVPAEIRERCVELILVAPRRRVGAALLSLLTPLSIGAATRVTGTARRTVLELSARADVTLLHGPHVAPLAHVVRGPLVLQVVDPWSLRVRMEAGMARGLRALYRRRKARQALVSERTLPSRARLLTVGQRDAATWSAEVGRPVASLGNGVDSVALAATPPSVPTVSFVGSLSYRPNVESAKVLVREIAPRVWERVPEMRVVIAGRQPDVEVLALASDQVEVRANVPSVSEVFLSSSVAVFADRHGLGVRNSVKEALAAGVRVVASVSAAREQEPHPLLTVAADEGELVELVVVALTSPRPVVLPGQEGLRSWSQVAADYLRECQHAASDDRAPSSGSRA